MIKLISDVNAIEWECDERKVAIFWKIMGIYMGVYGLSISILHGYLLVHFPMLWEIDEKVLAFLI